MNRLFAEVCRDRGISALWGCGERGSRTLRLTTLIDSAYQCESISESCKSRVLWTNRPSTCAFSKFLLLQDLFYNIYLPTFVVFNVQRLFSIGGVFESGVFAVAAEVQLLTPPCCHGGTLTLSATEVEDIPCEIA